MSDNESNGEAPQDPERIVNTGSGAIVQSGGVGAGQGGAAVGGDVGAIIINNYPPPPGPPRSPPQPEPPAPGDPPFKGLDYFAEEDSKLFFGRENLIATLVGRLREQRLLILVGASGAGKSSVLHAGILAALQHGQTLADGTR